MSTHKRHPFAKRSRTSSATAIQESQNEQHKQHNDANPKRNPQEGRCDVDENTYDAENDEAHHADDEPMQDVVDGSVHGGCFSV